MQLIKSNKHNNMSTNTEIRLKQLLELVDTSNVQEMELYEGARTELTMYNLSDKEYLRLMSNMYICLKDFRLSQEYGSANELTDLFEIFFFEL